MYLKPPIPRMNSPSLTIQYHQPKGCTVSCSPFSMLKMNKGGNAFMLKTLSQSIKSNWKRPRPALNFLLLQFLQSPS